MLSEIIRVLVVSDGYITLAIGLEDRDGARLEA